jgi:hypothetical protein
MGHGSGSWCCSLVLLTHIYLCTRHFQEKDLGSQKCYQETLSMVFQVFFSSSGPYVTSWVLFCHFPCRREELGSLNFLLSLDSSAPDLLTVPSAGNVPASPFYLEKFNSFLMSLGQGGLLCSSPDEFYCNLYSCFIKFPFVFHSC